MQVRIYLLPGEGSIGSMNVRGFNAFVNALRPDATVYMAATKDDERFERAREIEDDLVIVVEVSADRYDMFRDKFGWKKLKDVPLDSGTE